MGCGKFQVQFGKFDGELLLTVVSGNLPSLLSLDWFKSLGM